MSTDTDGAPPSVAPEPDNGSGSAETAGPGSESTTDSGTAWLQEEIQRRIAAARNGSGGRHARHGGPDPAPAPPDYRGRHATEHPEPVRRRQAAPPSPSQPSVGDDGAEAPTAWTRARALHDLRPVQPRADPGQDSDGRPEVAGAGAADLNTAARPSETGAPAPDPDAGPSGPNRHLQPVATPEAPAEPVSAAPVPADAVAPTPVEGLAEPDQSVDDVTRADPASGPAPAAPPSDGPGVGATGSEGVGAAAVGLTDETQVDRDAADPGTAGRADDGQALVDPGTASPATISPQTAEAPAAAEPADAAPTGEDGAAPAAESAPSAVEQTTPRPVPSTWSGIGRPPTDDGAAAAPSHPSQPRRPGDSGIGVIGGPSLPDIRPVRRPRAVPLSSTWGRRDTLQHPEAPPADTTPPSDGLPLPATAPTAVEPLSDGPPSAQAPTPEAALHTDVQQTDSGPPSDVRRAWQAPASDGAAQPGLRPPWQPTWPDAGSPRPAPPSGPAAARLLSDPPSVPPTVAIPTVPRLPAVIPTAQPELEELDEDLDDDYADDADDGDGVIWRASTPAPTVGPPAPTAAEAPPAPAYPPGKRVRVVLAERKAAARPVRTVVDIQEDGAVGEVLRSELIGSQMRVALGFALMGGLPLFLLPAVFDLFPDIGTIAIFGLRLPWLLLGLLVYPFLFGLGWWFTHVAERVEQDFADHVQE